MNWEEVLSDSKLWKMVRRKLLLIIVFTVGLIFGLFHLDEVSGILSRVISLFSPFLVGIAFAFVMNILVRLLEEKIFRPLNRRDWKVWKKVQRAVSILLAFAILSVFMTIIIVFIIPEFISSLHFFSDNLPGYVKQFSHWLTETISRFDFAQDPETQALFQIDWSKPLEKITQTVSNLAGSLVTFTISVASGIISFILSVIFSIYLLFSKEKLLRNVRRVLYAFFPKERAQHMVAVGSLANRIFSGFVTGQMTEAIIIGTLCYIGMMVMGLPYALLISVVISMTSLVPILGAYLGGAVGAFVLLMIDPIYSLWFLVFLVLLQQFEGNVIYPRVVGSSIGLPGLWVMLAILICGNLFGVTGILLGVPLFSVFYSLLRQETELRLRQKKLTENEVMGEPDELTADAIEEPLPDSYDEDEDDVAEHQTKED